MKRVTSVTEKTISEMVKNDTPYSSELAYILREMKSRVSCDGASITEMKSWNITLDNSTQINVIGSNELRGLGYTYNDFIRYVGTLNLSYVNIDDFNGLVKSVKSGNGKHNPHKG